MGVKNPNLTTQAERNTINLSRAFFQTDWIYEPTAAFALFARVKLISDQTENFDNELMEYDAFPLSTPRYFTYLRANDDNDFLAELSELYVDLNPGNLWFRLGKQQIVWGEMIAGRILDIINPLDLSWHLQFEPEEFENIRIPQMMIRSIYSVTQMAGRMSWLHELYFEGFINPGDVTPTILPDYGSPYTVKPPHPPLPTPQFTDTVKDRRGDIEGGVRIGFRVGQVAATLNYLYLYSDSGFEETTGGSYPYFTADIKYPQTDLYGLSVNYALPEPFNTTINYEALYSPNEPFYDAASATPTIRYHSYMKHAINFGRKFFILPAGQSAASVNLQYAQERVKDHELIKSTGAPYDPDANSLDSTKNLIAATFSQDVWHSNIQFSLTAVYDLDDAHMLRPGIKYIHGDHWIFDIYLVEVGGAEARTNRFGSFPWDEIYGRITFQF
jgi:hypothetical protein